MVARSDSKKICNLHYSKVTRIYSSNEMNLKFLSLWSPHTEISNVGQQAKCTFLHLQPEMQRPLFSNPSSQGVRRHHEKKLKTVSFCFLRMYVLGFVYCWPIIITDHHHLHYPCHNHRAFTSHRHFMKNYSAPLMTIWSVPCFI